jgi:hypothetical protein
MGRSIVYCDKCGTLLREEDFRQGKALVADNRSYCSACKPASSSVTPPQPPTARKASSGRIPKQAAPEGITSSRLPKQPQHQSRPIPMQAPAPPPAEGAGSNARVIGIVIAGLVLAGAAVATMFSGGRKESQPSSEPAAATPIVQPLPPPKVENLNPEERRREEAARAACVKAYEVQTTRPKDLAAQWRAFEAAVAAAQGTSYASDATTQLAKVRRRFEEERQLVESRSQEVLAREQFRPALEVWESELGRFDIPEWTQPLQARIAELKSDFERRLGVMRDAAVEARKRGDDAEARRIRARVAGWGLAGYAEQVDQAMAGVVPERKEPLPGTGAPAALVAYRAKWKELLTPTRGRDLAELQKGLEKLAGEAKAEAAKEAADDLENLRLAASVFQESALLLAKLARGQRVALTYYDPAGAPVRTDEVLLKIDGQRLEMKQGDGSVVIPFGEIAAATLADLFKGRASRKESDIRAAVAACLLDGDPDGAQRLRTEPLPELNEKYVEAARELQARRAKDDKEAAARTLFYEAERDFFDYGETGGALLKFKSLLADHAGTAFVKRNRAAIAARVEGGFKDFLFANGDLVVTPGFKLGKYGRVEAAWVSQQDVEPAKMKDSYVQLEISALPEAEYRVWILAGGCCQEVLTFHVQATELVAPDPEKPREKSAAEPGSAVSMIVKSTNSSLRKLHSQHNGPKTPERFDWVLAGTFKFPTAGPKKIRILTGQKGFAVAQAAVLSTRPGPPRELEYKELDRWRAETPGAQVKQGGVVTGCILREVWKNIGGGNVEELTSTAGFKEDRPDERGMLTSFEAPQDIGDSYGTRIRGYVHPPLSGAYVFWIAADDAGELWLSTDEDPVHKVKIAFLTSYASPREYGKFPEQKSRPIDLKAGRRYYIEALHKEGGGGDHVSVKWLLPTGAEELPIPGNRLSPFVPAKK